MAPIERERALWLSTLNPKTPAILSLEHYDWLLTSSKIIGWSGSDNWYTTLGYVSLTGGLVYGPSHPSSDELIIRVMLWTVDDLDKERWQICS